MSRAEELLLRSKLGLRKAIFASKSTFINDQHASIPFEHENPEAGVAPVRRDLIKRTIRTTYESFGD